MGSITERDRHSERNGLVQHRCDETHPVNMLCDVFRGSPFQVP